MKEQNSDWRLPLIDELKTLVVKGSHPAIDAKVFPGCPAAGFWSGSPYAGYSNYAWVVHFDDGYADYYGFRSNFYRVRLVRGGQDFDPLWSALDTEGRWYDCGDGLAFDRTTGLQWQRYCVGQSWVEGKPSGRPDLLTWDEAMSRFGNGVPEGEEEGFDNIQALREGWDLFDVEGRLQLQRIDAPSDHEFLDYEKPKFASDADAIIFVALQARAGSVYHRRALEHIGTQAAE
jgi:hypothetical protein